MPSVDWTALQSALRRPRTRVLLALLGLAIAARIALPHVLRPILVSQADAALVGRIALADLDLALIRGGVALRGLEVYTDELSPPEAGSTAKPPLFEARRLWVQISWLALLTRTLYIEQFELEDFAVRLERTADGIPLPSPVPSAEEPEPAPAPEPESGSGWTLAADAVRLRKGAIAFVDRTLGSDGQRFDLAIQDLSADQLALEIAPSGREPGRVVLVARIDDGSIAVDSRVETLAAGPSLTTRLMVANLPLRDVRAYLKPLFGWSELEARLDAEIVHHFESGGAHDVSGRATLRDVAVRVSGLERPALAWQALDVELDKIDLVAQDAAVARVRLSGPRIPIDLRAAVPLPLLAPPASDAARASPPVAASAPSPSSPDEPDKPWTWRVGTLRIADGALELLGGGEPLLLGLDVELRDVDSKPASRWPLHVELREGQGRVGVHGTLAIAPLAFDGTLAIADLALPPLLARVPAPGAALLRAGAARAELRIALAPRATGDSGASPTDLRVSGTLGLANLDVGDPASAREFAAAWKDFEVGVRELDASDVLGAGGPRSIAVRLDRVALVEPSLVLTRSADGIVLPPLSGVAPAAVPSPPPAGPEPAPPPEIAVELASARIERARARIQDRSVTPAFRSQIDRLDLDGRGLRWPSPQAQSLALDLRGLGGARLDVRGSAKPSATQLEIKLSALPLAQFSPYVSSSGFSLNGGSLALDSRARFGSAGYDASTGLVVSRLDVGGTRGASMFQESFGIPFSVALGLLEDLKGDIKLSVPVASDGSGARVQLRSVVAQALRAALVGALASPLKLLGAVTAGGKVESLVPAPIPFPDGSAELGPEGEARLAELAALLDASPGISLTLIGALSDSDVRVLRERALLAELQSSNGVRALGALGEIATRRAVRVYLEARHAAGPPAELDAEQQAWLETRIRLQRLDPAKLEALASARAAAARSALGALRSIAPERLALGTPSGEILAEAPGVAIELGTPHVAAP